MTYIIPLLFVGFGVEKKKQPKSQTRWHAEIYIYLIVEYL